MNGDTQFKEYKIESVHLESDDYFSVRSEDGWTLWVRNLNNLPLPVPGETARYYGRGFGYPVRGFSVGDRVYYYESEEEYDIRFAQEQRVREEEKKRSWEKDLIETEKRVARLPGPLADRLNRFMAITDWGWRFGPYELAVCETAARLADHLKTDVEIVRFATLGYEDQDREIAGIGEEHSGNSFGASIWLARLLVTHPEWVVNAHGALCPLVGCDEYGCWAAEKR